MPDDLTARNLVKAGAEALTKADKFAADPKYIQKSSEFVAIAHEYGRLAEIAFELGL